MSDFLIAFLATLSAATWVYTKANRRTGGNTQNALVVAGVAGIIVFIVVFTVVSMITSKIEN